MSLIERWLKRLRPNSDGLPDELERTRASAAPPRLVTIGVDFGTSGTKVVFRDVLSKEETTFVVDFGTRSPGYCRFSWPSTIALNEDEMLFGEQAQGQSRERYTIIRSPKMQLLKMRPDETDADVPVEFPGVQGALQWPEFVAAAYVWDVLRRVTPIVEEKFRNLGESDVLYNICAPIENLEGHRAAPAFQRVLGAAIAMNGADAGPHNPGEIWHAWRTARREFSSLSARERRSSVVPESQAIIMGSAKLGDIRGDVYKAVIDIGAGTTDGAFFKLVEREGKLYFFSAGTLSRGCRDIDRACAANIRSDPSWEHLPEWLLFDALADRKAELLRGEDTSLSHGGQRLIIRANDYLGCSTDTADEVFSHYRRLCGRAYEKEPSSDRWYVLKVILAGGGSCVPTIVERFRRHPKTFGEHVEVIPLGHPDGVVVAGESEVSPTDEEVPFLLTVLGLATPKPQMPTAINPDDIGLMEIDRGAAPLYGWEAPDHVG